MTQMSKLHAPTTPRKRAPIKPAGLLIKARKKPKGSINIPKLGRIPKLRPLTPPDNDRRPRLKIFSLSCSDTDDEVNIITCTLVNPIHSSFHYSPLSKSIPANPPHSFSLPLIHKLIHIHSYQLTPNPTQTNPVIHHPPQDKEVDTSSTHTSFSSSSLRAKLPIPAHLLPLRPLLLLLLLHLQPQVPPPQVSQHSLNTTQSLT